MSEDTAQPTARVYSQRLGALTPQQFQAALTRSGLGTFVSATPVAQGLFGQNVFVQSTQGDYVLRGVPHYPWQFPLARAFASTYLTQKPARQGFAERYALYMLRDRLIVWEYGTRPGNNWFRQGQSFRDYAEPFTLSWRLVVPDTVS